MGFPAGKYCAFYPAQGAFCIDFTGLTAYDGGNENDMKRRAFFAARQGEKHHISARRLPVPAGKGQHMEMKKDLSAILPDGRGFDFWEVNEEGQPRAVYDRVLHVNGAHPAADDGNEGSEERPFRTIGAAAKIATPGTRVLVHGGIYRECVRPAMGGESPERMISYEAAGDGPVIIRASEEVTDFKPSEGWMLHREFGRATPAGGQREKVWEHDLDPDMFRGYNPFCAVNILHDRLFIEYEKTDMTTYLNRRGCVFCDGEALEQVPLYNGMAARDGTYWVEANGQKVHFRLKGDADPKNHRIEITVREQCFAPEIPFLSYIRVKGFICEHAATGAPVPQRGAISAYRGHHWIIEDCEVNWSNALAIDIGNECWHHAMDPDQIIGCSIVRRCRIRDAGVCGIAGLWAGHMLIEDNIIEGTGWQKMELSWEAGAIKLHNSVDGLIRRNIFRNTFRADHIWLDCGNVNNRITGNLFLDGIEQREAIFIECTREGVNLIDNNIIWNVEGRFDPKKIPDEPGSKGWYKLREDEYINGYGIYGEGTDRLYIVNNLIAKCRHSGYYLKPVPFRTGFDRGGTSRKARIFNNIFYDCGEAAIVMPTADNQSEGNLFVREKGGYLRVMYPEPEVCLNLKTWQEFYGFDQTGRNGWFDMVLDRETGTLTVKAAPDAPIGFPDTLKLMNYVTDPAGVPAVAPAAPVRCDYAGADRGEGNVTPGPFSKIAGKHAIFAVKERA